MNILAIDFGDAMSGLDVCDELEILATPLKVIKHKNTEALVEEIKKIIDENSIQGLVLGLPKNMDSSLGFRAQKSLEFAKKLEEETGIEVALWDERLTTVAAHGFLNTTNVRGKKRKNLVDAVAATIILQDYINSRKNQNF